MLTFGILILLCLSPELGEAVSDLKLIICTLFISTLRMLSGELYIGLALNKYRDVTSSESTNGETSGN
jgi:hypothetical protein